MSDIERLARIWGERLARHEAIRARMQEHRSVLDELRQESTNAMLEAEAARLALEEAIRQDRIADHDTEPPAELST